MPRRFMALAISAFLLVLTLAPAEEVDARAEARLKRLVEKAADSTGDREALRNEVLTFQRVFAGSGYALRAAELLAKLPSGLDQLDPKSIPELERFAFQPKELVAVLGEHRGRHGAAVGGVAFSPDGKSIVSGGGHLIRLWDARTMRLQHLFGYGTTRAVAFSRDGKSLVTGGTHVAVWDLADDKPPRMRFGATAGSAGVYSVAYAPHGKAVAAACHDNATRLYDEAGKEVAVITGHTQYVRAVCYSPDGKLLVTGGGDQSIRTWNATDTIPRERSVLTGPTSAVTALAYSPAGNALAAGTADGKLYLYAMPAATKPRATFESKGSGAIHHLNFSASGNTIAAACNDGTVRLWALNTSTGKPAERAKLEGHVGPCQSAAYSPDLKLLVSGGDDWMVRTWDLTTPRLNERFVPASHLSHIYSAPISPDGKSIATGSYDGAIRTWDVAQPEPKVRHFLKSELGYVYQVLFSPDGKALSGYGHSAAIRTWDPQTGRLLRTMLPGFRPNGLSYTPNGRFLLTTHHTTAYLIDEPAGQIELTFPHPEKPINAFGISPDGKTLATGTGGYLYDDKNKIVVRDGQYVWTDCVLRLWDAESGKEKQALKDFRTGVYYTQFTPDGSRLLYYLYNESQTRSRPAADPTGPESLAYLDVPSGFGFSPDGKTLIRGHNGGYGFDLYDAGTGKKRFTFSCPESLGSVSFSNDCRHLTVPLRTGVVYVLRVPPMQ